MAPSGEGGWRSRDVGGGEGVEQGAILAGEELNALHRGEVLPGAGFERVAEVGGREPRGGKEGEGGRKWSRHPAFRQRARPTSMAHAFTPETRAAGRVEDRREEAACHEGAEYPASEHWVATSHVFDPSIGAKMASIQQLNLKYAC